MKSSATTELSERKLSGSDEAVVPPPLDGDGPLWLQIRRAIAHPIQSGEWPAGTRIPPEMLLNEFYRTSRMTVNKAIQSLAAEGLVQRRTKQGTIVTDRARERPVMEVWDAADAVHRAGGRYSYRLLRSTRLGAGHPRRAPLGVDADTPVLSLSSLHLSNDLPFQLEERLINLAAVPGIVHQDLDKISPGAWLLAHVPLTEVRHRISARAASDEVAGHLRLEMGEACLVVERRTWNDAVPITYGRFWYPGEDHSLEGAFRPSW
ncbi:MAG: GntR family transcriptional regulator [Sphingomonas sp.]|uniref:UTRA domain-containing protein n=1 Tax=Sphingomonas sp. TaxID=28214 RepID=UPI000DBC2037|nr:UTRA domain-containing protein [Sphingomonas sp.]PZU79611.1 MAG: GntR family transcriptional regulator [Sphingomonas sp.]